MNILHMLCIGPFEGDIYAYMKPPVGSPAITRDSSALVRLVKSAYQQSDKRGRGRKPHVQKPDEQKPHG